jgi:hypothetical protein
MREMMQKALTAMSVRRDSKVSDRHSRPSGSVQSKSASPENWGMSPEDALKATMVSGYK